MTDIVVDTDHGPLRGRRAGGLTVFAGVPFAAPPTGDRRLAPPQPVDHWSGVRDALTLPPAPSQGTSALRGDRNADSRPARLGWSGGPAAAHFAAHLAAVDAATRNSAEDCLYLNVWTPDHAGDRPVIVYLFGGGFDAGSASPPVTDGAALARATDCVVVTVNYRLGALGFLHLADLGGAEWAGSTNLGLQDQAAALRWVQANIAAFGGDPKRVTLAGQSAGAFSVGALLTMPAADGTFQRAILHSGSTQRVFPASTATSIAEDLLSALGVDDLGSLRTLPVQRILEVQNLVIDTDIGRRNLPGGRSWGVVLDGNVLPRHPHEALTYGAARDITLLVGANHDEMQIFQRIGAAAFRPADEAALLAEISRGGAAHPGEVLDGYRRRLSTSGAAPDLADLRAAFLTDYVYREPATRLAATQIAAGGTAYHYVFADAPLGPGLGAFHGCEGIYLFEDLDRAGITSTRSRAVGDAFRHAWAAFAWDGQPGWPSYDPRADNSTQYFGGNRSGLVS